jgi:hypothetical protein
MLGQIIQIRGNAGVPGFPALMWRARPIDGILNGAWIGWPGSRVNERQEHITHVRMDNPAR